MAMNGRPPSCPTAWVRTMHGPPSSSASSPSRRNMSTNRASLASRGCMTLIASSHHFTTKRSPGLMRTERSSTRVPLSSLTISRTARPSLGTSAPTSGELTPRSSSSPGARGFSIAIRPKGLASWLTMIAQSKRRVARWPAVTVAYSKIAIS
jgi:hypothetical protein